MIFTENLSSAYMT